MMKTKRRLQSSVTLEKRMSSPPDMESIYDIPLNTKNQVYLNSCVIFWVLNVKKVPITSMEAFVTTSKNGPTVRIAVESTLILANLFY